MTGAARPVLVLAPLAVEARAVRRGDPRLRVERVGMGPRRARQAAERFARVPAAAVAVVGLCGAVDPALAPGTALVPDALDTPDGGHVAVDAEPLRAALRARGIEARGGRLMGVDYVVSAAERQALFAAGARAVDMESPWLAAAAAGRPFAVLRVVVDGPGAELWRAGLPWRALRALRALRLAAPALFEWALDRAPSSFPEAPASAGLGHAR